MLSEAADESLDNVLIFGPVGSGKTTILNLLTGETFPTAGDGYSCTRTIQCAPSLYHQYRVVDFPGTDSAVDVVKHAEIQAVALRSLHFRIVCITHAMSPRLDDVTMRLAKVRNLFRHHIDNLAVILTHCDKVELKTIDDTKFIFESKFKISRVFAKDKDTDPKRLSHWLYSHINPYFLGYNVGRMLGALAKIKVGEGIFDTDAFSGLIKDRELDDAVLDARRKTEEEFRKIYEEHRKLFNETEDRELRRALYFSLKTHMDRVSEEHARDVVCLFTDKWELQAELIVLQNALMTHFGPFKVLVTNQIEVDNVVYNNSGPSYRKCPECNEIWLRIYGCDSITCGKRSISRDVKNTTFYSYTLVWENGRMSVIKNQIQPTQVAFSDKEIVGLTTEEQEKNKTLTTPIKPSGCGATMEWNKMLDVTKEVVEQLKEFDFCLTGETGNIADAHETELGKVPSGTEDPLSTFLTQQGFDGKVILIFKKEGIDSEAFLHLTLKDLEEMGIKRGDRIKLNQLISKQNKK